MLSGLASAVSVAFLVACTFATMARAQPLPDINSCKQESLGALSSQMLLVGDSVLIHSPSGPVTYTAQPGESIWSLCALTLRASEAFQPKIESIEAAATAEREAAQKQGATVSNLQNELTKLRQQVAGASRSASGEPTPGTPAALSGSSGSTSDGSEASLGRSLWIPWAIAAFAGALAMFFFVRSLVLSRRLAEGSGAYLR